jgi:CubicO group peptidase (beta-lactamase class C family)
LIVSGGGLNCLKVGKENILYIDAIFLYFNCIMQAAKKCSPIHPLYIILVFFISSCNEDDSITRSSNKSPTCEIVTPAENTSFTEKDSIMIRARISDPENNAYTVKFYIDDQFVYQDYDPPFEYTCHPQDLDIGEHVITATAIDRFSATGSGQATIRILYTYQIPEDRDDGWELSSLVLEGLDSLKIGDMMFNIYDNENSFIHSIVLVKNGRLIFEEYFNGYTIHSNHHMQSATKSLASALIGIAIDKGYIEGVDVPIFNYFPEYHHLLDSLKSEINLHHVLSMTAGFEWNEHQIPYAFPENDSYIGHQTNYIEYLLSKSVVHDPGAVFAYNSGCSILLGGIIERATESSVQSFARENLFKPLGIHYVHWDELVLTNDLAGTHGMLHMRSRDVAKFGQLFLNGGQWKGVEIISEDWIERSTTSQIRKPSGYKFTHYGYQWHVGEIYANPRMSDTNVYQTYSALGAGGQFMIVLPEVEMIIVTTANPNSNFGDLENQDQEIIRLIEKYILPSII